MRGRVGCDGMPACLGDAKRADEDDEVGRSMTSSVNDGCENESRILVGDARALGAIVWPG